MGTEPRFVTAGKHLIGDAIRWGWDKAFRYGSIVPGTRAAARFGHFGSGTIVAFPQASLYGERYMWLGDDVRVGPYSSLSCGLAPGQELVLDPTLRIGDRSVIGRGSAVAAHFSVEIGDDVWFAPECFVCDQHHDYLDVAMPIGLQLSEAAPVRIGSRSWLGHGVIVLPGVTIGEHVAVAAGAIVTKDIPSYSVAAGAPARVIREHDPADGWVRVRPPSPSP